MTTDINYTSLAIFIFFFLLVTVMGFVAARWRKPETLAHIDEWGLGGRNFGTWITWFLVGGDFYTAYTVIAVPALVYTVGAYGFFALPYTIVVYPFVFMVMPVLWRKAKDFGYVTAGDVVHGQYGSRALELAVAITGVIATMPYIALQLVGMAAVLKALGPGGHLVNISRGIAVDEDALCAALETGAIAGAALDVYENEPHVSDRLRALDNIVLAPHIAAATELAQAAQQDTMLGNLEAFFAGRPLLSAVAL